MAVAACSYEIAVWLRAAGHSSAALWEGMKDIIIKSLIAVQPLLAYEYALATANSPDPHRCFEVRKTSPPLPPPRPQLRYLHIDKSPQHGSNTPRSADPHQSTHSASIR